MALERCPMKTKHRVPFLHVFHGLPWLIPVFLGSLLIGCAYSKNLFEDFQYHRHARTAATMGPRKVIRGDAAPLSGYQILRREVRRSTGQEHYLTLFMKERGGPPDYVEKPSRTGIRLYYLGEGRYYFLDIHAVHGDLTLIDSGPIQMVARELPELPEVDEGRQEEQDEPGWEDWESWEDDLSGEDDVRWEGMDGKSADPEIAEEGSGQGTAEKKKRLEGELDEMEQWEEWDRWGDEEPFEDMGEVESTERQEDAEIEAEIEAEEEAETETSGIDGSEDVETVEGGEEEEVVSTEQEPLGDGAPKREGELDEEADLEESVKPIESAPEEEPEEEKEEQKKEKQDDKEEEDDWDDYGGEEF